MLFTSQIVLYRQPCHADAVYIVGARTQVVAIMTIDLSSEDWRLS